MIECQRGTRLDAGYAYSLLTTSTRIGGPVASLIFALRVDN